METATTYLAIWGAVVSTIAILWNIRRDLGDRGKLQVICYIGKIVGDGPGDSGSKLVYNVTNIGRRPVVVTTIGGAFSNERHFLVPTALMPRTLQPGDYFLVYSMDLSILQDKPQALWEIDSAGKYWKISKKQLRHVLDQVAVES